MRRHLTALLVAGLLLGACGDDDDSGDQAAVTSIPEETATSTSTTTEPRTVAPDVIPQEESQITEEYVEQVLDELYGISLQAIKHTREAGIVDESTIELVESIYSPPQSRVALNGLIDLARRSFEGYRDDPTPVTADVAEVLQRNQECIFSEVRFDTSGLVNEPAVFSDTVRGFVRLLPASDQQRVSGRNSTAWVIDALPVTKDGSVPTETCPP